MLELILLENCNRNWCHNGHSTVAELTAPPEPTKQEVHDTVSSDSMELKPDVKFWVTT